jgi:4-hydroxybenzoate polyprenyltransferase
VFDYLVVAIACLALIFYWISAMLFNDVADFKGDSISNPERPLPSGKFIPEEIKTLAIFFLVLSCLASFAVSYSLFLLILLRSCLGYLYSGKPFRLKKIPLVSTFILALAAFTTVLGGIL